MISLSLCMIVRDEEAVLERCLEAVAVAVDEIIIVDTGSEDATKTIAARFTEKIYDFTWCDDFAAARNYAFEQASCDYLLWLDADDVVEAAELRKLQGLKETLDPAVDIIYLPYHVAFDEQENPTFTYERERIVKRSRHYRWQGRIHEAIVAEGRVMHGDVVIQHRKVKQGDPDRNLRIFERMIAEGDALQPREQYYYGRELSTHERYEEAAAVLAGFLADGQGWLEDLIGACRELAACYQNLEQGEKALNALFHSFVYDKPRAEVCCDIGYYYLARNDYEKAIFWYEIAASGKTGRAGGFIAPDCYGYIPYLQLCVCYDRLGDRARARQYNERAAKIKPDSSAVLYNRRYFDRIVGGKE